jgi:hypothetical protein
LHPADPNIAIAKQAPLHTLLANQIALDEGSFPAPRSYASGAMVRFGRGLVSGNCFFAVILGVDKRSSLLFDAVVARTFVRATITAVERCVSVRR